MSLEESLSPAEPALEWGFADWAAVLLRRRGWILASLAGCALLAALYGTWATPRYRATAQIEVEKESRGGFGLDSATADRQVTAVSDSFDDNLTLQTETGILESDAICLEAVRKTGLEGTEDYFAPQPERSWGRLMFWRRPVEPLTVPLEEAPNRRAAALRIFARHRKIGTVAGTRLIAVSYADPSPQRAAAVVAALLEALRDYEFESRSE